MGTRNPDTPHQDAHDPTSEVAESRSVDPWQALLDLQSQTILQLIESIKDSASSSKAICLPEFNPDQPDANAFAWSTTVDICQSEKPLNGASLIIALSKSMKGSASTWFPQISYSGMTWQDFKTIFLSRYDVTETSAATMVNFNNSQPKDGELLAAYATRMITLLMAKWNGLTVEQIAVATVFAHVSKFDSRALRLAFTSDVTSKNKLQQELNVLTVLKRSSQDQIDSSESKRSKSEYPICHFCGIMGHKAPNCRTKAEQQESITSTTTKPSPTSKIICFRCGESGHIAPRCPNQSAVRPFGAAASRVSITQPAAKTTATSERRVESCEVLPIAETSKQSGEQYSFC